MIVYDLACRPGGHRFEGWFASSDDFAAQQARGLVSCPQCGGAEVLKAPMAPAIGRKGNQMVAAAPHPAAPAAVDGAPAPARAMPATPPAPTPPPMPPAVRAALIAVAAAQAQALRGSRWVGKRFAEDARAMHYGEAEPAVIHGQATPAEAAALAEEGVAIMPLLVPIAPPDEIN